MWSAHRHPTWHKALCTAHIIVVRRPREELYTSLLTVCMTLRDDYQNHPFILPWRPQNTFSWNTWSMDFCKADSPSRGIDLYAWCVRSAWKNQRVKEFAFQEAWTSSPSSTPVRWNGTCCPCVITIHTLESLRSTDPSLIAAGPWLQTNIGVHQLRSMRPAPHHSGRLGRWGSQDAPHWYCVIGPFVMD